MSDIGRSHGIRAKYNFSRGVKRLWVATTLVWYIVAIGSSAPEVAKWLGYHYGLWEKNGNITLALAEKSKTQALIDSCRAAFARECLVGEGGYNVLLETKSTRLDRISSCRESDAFKVEFIKGVWRRGLVSDVREEYFSKADNREIASICASAEFWSLPRIDWLAVLVVIFLPIFCYVVLRIISWVIAGFKTADD